MGELQEHAEELDALIFALAVINSNELLAILFKVALFFEELDHDFESNLYQQLLVLPLWFAFHTLRFTILALLD